MSYLFLHVLFVAAFFTTVVFAIIPGFPYGSQKVRGVNLGGWLVFLTGVSFTVYFLAFIVNASAIGLSWYRGPWITPSLFDDTGDDRIVDEYTFGKYQDSRVATSKLQNHWDSWITEDDFSAIAAAGLNHVRLPIGYWAWDVSGGEPYIQGQIEYLDRAITWAERHNIKVIIDLHGVPGSQNGFDNSGQRLDRPTWQIDQLNIDRSHSIIKTITAKYAKMPTVVPIIAPLSMPAGFDGDVLPVVRQYWYDTYGNVRYLENGQQSDTVVLFHDAFKGLTYWRDFMSDRSRYQGVAFDTHIYQMFSQNEVSRSDAGHISSACSYADTLSSFPMWAIVGEWTPAPTDCAKYLNGRGRGSRYDGTLDGSIHIGDCSTKTGSGSSFDKNYKAFLRQYWEAQVITFEMGTGWIQWTWKAEGADDWSYQAGLQYGWIPQDPTSFLYPDICK